MATSRQAVWALVVVCALCVLPVSNGSCQTPITPEEVFSCSAADRAYFSSNSPNVWWTATSRAFRSLSHHIFSSHSPSELDSGNCLRCLEIGRLCAPLSGVFWADPRLQSTQRPTNTSPACLLSTTTTLAANSAVSMSHRDLSPTI